MSNLSTFVFNQSDVRVLSIDNEPWFVAKDLCDVLELSEVSNSLKRLDEDEKQTRTLFVSGQNRDVWVVSESGMYALVLTSRKPQAKSFKKWITAEVLPSIRKTGLFNTLPFKLSDDSTLATFEYDDYWVISTTIAEVFGKQHDNVIRDLRLAMKDRLKFEEMSEELPDFKLIESTYIDSYGRTQRCYKVNRDLFNYVVLAYQGDNAKLYRMKFIKAFTDLENKVKVFLTQQMIHTNPNRQQVYVLKNLTTGLVKMGITKDIKQRVNQLQNASGCEIEVVFLAPKADNARDVEQDLHKEFKDVRGIGEWFSVNPEHVIESLKEKDLVILPLDLTL